MITKEVFKKLMDEKRQERKYELENKKKEKEIVENKNVKNYEEFKKWNVSIVTGTKLDGNYDLDVQINPKNSYQFDYCAKGQLDYGECVCTKLFNVEIKNGLFYIRTLISNKNCDSKNKCLPPANYFSYDTLDVATEKIIEILINITFQEIYANNCQPKSRN